MLGRRGEVRREGRRETRCEAGSEAPGAEARAAAGAGARERGPQSPDFESQGRMSVPRRLFTDSLDSLANVETLRSVRVLEPPGTQVEAEGKKPRRRKKKAAAPCAQLAAQTALSSISFYSSWTPLFSDSLSLSLSLSLSPTT